MNIGLITLKNKTMSILTKVFAWISGAAKKVTEALGFGKKIANLVKGVIDSPILDVLVNLTTTPLDNAALNYIRPRMQEWVDKIGWAEKKISDFDETTLPHVLNSVNAEVSKLYADFKNIELSRPQAIASAQVVYDPTIIN